jgi:hypothetical protein
LKHAVRCRSQSVPYAGFHLLKILVFDLGDEVLHVTTKEKNPVGLRLVA